MIALWLACQEPVLIEQPSIRQSLSETKNELVVEVLVPDGQRADLVPPTSSSLKLTESGVQNHRVPGGRREVWSFALDGKDGKHIVEASALRFSSSAPIKQTERVYVELGKNGLIGGLQRAKKPHKSQIWLWFPLLIIGAAIAFLFRKPKPVAASHWLIFEGLIRAPATKSQAHQLARWLRLRLEHLGLGHLSVLSAAECAERMSRHHRLAESQRLFLAEFFAQLQQAQYGPVPLELDWQGLRIVVEDLEAVLE